MMLGVTTHERTCAEALNWVAGVETRVLCC